MEIVGNEDFIKIVNLAKHQQPFPHTLIYGPSGAGKTTLARYISNAISSKKTLSMYGPDVEKMMLSMQLRAIGRNSIMIIDEIHALKKGLVETIYQPIEEFIFGTEPINPFTMIGITTDLNMLPDALIRRFRLVYRVQLYEVEQLYEIVSGLSKKKISGDAIEAIATFSRGSPGMARNHIELIESMYPEPIDLDEIYDYMRLKHIDTLGLEAIDIEYLNAVGRFDALALSTLSSLLSEREKTIEENLKKLGYIS